MKYYLTQENYQRLVLTYLKRLAVESQIQSRILVELYAAEKQMTTEQIWEKYSLLYKVTSKAFQNLIFQEYGEIDIDDLFGDQKPPQEDF